MSLSKGKVYLRMMNPHVLLGKGSLRVFERLVDLLTHILSKSRGILLHQHLLESMPRYTYTYGFNESHSIIYHFESLYSHNYLQIGLYKKRSGADAP